MSGVRSILLFAALCATLSARAARDVGLEVDALNRAFPARHAETAVFSPASFELDCVVFAQTLGTIERAKMSETLGAISGLENVYAPVRDGLGVRTNGFSFSAARVFLVPDVRKADPKTRMLFADTYATSVCAGERKAGAEAWLRAALDGEMDDFAFPADEPPLNGRFAFVDLVSVQLAWRDPFPTENSKTLGFVRHDGTRVERRFMADVRPADIWDGDQFTLLKMPLRGDAEFYALLPKKDVALSDIRAKVSSQTIHRLLRVTDSLVEKGVSHGPAALVLPVFDLRSRVEFSGVLKYFKFPQKGFRQIAGAATARDFVQHVRFGLSESATGETPLVRKSAEDVTPIEADSKKLVFDHPFLFFVYHPSTDTILVAGQYAG